MTAPARATTSGMSAETIRSIRVRLFVLGLLFAASLGVIVHRAVTLQVADRGRLARLAAKQQRSAVDLPARRGPVLDRRGVPLAVSVEVESVFADPAMLADPREAARALARALDLDPARLLRSIEAERRFAWVERHVTPAEVEAVRALHLPGVGFVKEARRYYPERELAAHVVGLAGRDGEGLEGVEFASDDLLRGRPRRRVALRDALGRPLLADGAVATEEVEGAAVQLTIDRPIQFRAEQALRAAVHKTGAAAGMVVALEPATGAILALANEPTFNPNAPGPAEARRNRAAADQFEPGSTFKAFTVAAAIEAGAVRSDETVFCENGAWTVGGHTLRDTAPRGNLSPAQILRVSSNIGAAKIAARLGSDRIVKALGAFGFGDRPGAGLPGEARGRIPTPRAAVELATMGFGQGVTASALQVTSAFGAIGYGGVRMQPYLVARVVDPTGSVRFEAVPKPAGRAVSEKTARAVTAMLEGVLEPGGTAPLARPTGYRAAGKTGTAQKVDPVTRAYAKDRWLVSFVGFAPASAPRLAVGVFLDEPSDQATGGAAAGPVFREIVEEALPLLGVPAESLPTAAPAQPAPWRATAVEVPALPTASAQGPSRVGPEKAPPLPADDGRVAVPDALGLPVRDAVRRIAGADLEPRLSGSGRVIDQEPVARTVVERGAAVRLRLRAADGG